MKTRLLMLTLLAGSLLCADAGSLIRAEDSGAPPGKEKALTPREMVLEIAAGEVGVVEKTGRNDGEVDKYLESVGLGGSRAPYCAAYVYWVGHQALGDRNPYPRSAWSPDMVKGGERITETFQPKGGEAFGIYFPSKGRVAHTGLIEARQGSYLITNEGNTSSSAAVGSAADREGQGVYRKRRHWRQVRYAKDWLAEVHGPN
jgi:hypothetical protein